MLLFVRVAIVEMNSLSKQAPRGEIAASVVAKIIGRVETGDHSADTSFVRLYSEFYCLCFWALL